MGLTFWQFRFTDGEWGANVRECLWMKEWGIQRHCGPAEAGLRAPFILLIIIHTSSLCPTCT